MGGSKKSGSVEQKMYYPPGFASFFKEASQTIFPYISTPHYVPYLQQPSWMEQQLYSGLQNIMRGGGLTGVDWNIISTYLNRLSGSPFSRSYLFSPSIVLSEYSTLFKPTSIPSYYNEAQDISRFVNPYLQQLSQRIDELSQSLQKYKGNVSSLLRNSVPTLQGGMSPGISYLANLMLRRAGVPPINPNVWW